MCHNEQETICDVVERLLCAPGLTGRHLDIEVIDDGSTDASAERLRKAFGEQPNVTTFRHPRRQGIGSVLRHAFRATEHDAVVLLCGDLQFAPEDVVPLLDELAHADMVIALRPHRQDAAVRSLLTRFEYGLSRLLLGRAYPDVHWVLIISIFRDQIQSNHFWPLARTEFNRVSLR